MPVNKQSVGSSSLLKILTVLLLILLVLIFSALALFGWYYFKSKSIIGFNLFTNKNQTTVQAPSTQDTKTPIPVKPTPVATVEKPTTQPTPTSPKAPYIETTNVPGQKRYVNPRLGISFLYLENQNQHTIKIQEIGNKVYLYFQGQPYDSGQYVEVFPKDPNLSLKETLTNKFLTGYNQADCQVVSLKLPPSYPDIFQMADIEAVGADFSDDPASKWEKCPKTYTRTNGVSFFLMNPTAPNKFAFVSVGQFAILADNFNHAWQDTLALTNSKTQN